MDQIVKDAGTGEDLHAREAAYEKFVDANLKRNYVANYIHGMLGLTGFRLIYAPTFIPTYVHQLTGSDALVGLGTSLLQLGAILSPLISASRIEHQPRILPYAIRTGSMMRVMILGLALAGWFLAGPVLLIVTLALLFLLGIFNGTQRVAFQMLMSKVIPIARRGRLQAWRNITGGVIAAGLSYVAGRYLIGGKVFGNGYATTFFLTFVLTSLGLTVLQLVLVEPDPPSRRPAMRFLDRLKEFPVLLEDRDYRWFILAEALTVCARLASPFYVLYAGQQLGLSGTTIGELSLAYLGADTVSNLLWGHLGDRTGYRITFLLAAGIWGAAVLLLILIHQPWAVFVAFCGLGAGNSGYLMSQQTMVLEFGQRNDVAMRLALSTTIEGMISTIGPLLGGLLAVTLGYGVLMSCSVGFLGGAFLLLLFKVREPRKRARTQAAGVEPAPGVLG
ncbi:MAG: MFS transporter [Caulobacteraceae bacterium]